MPAVLLQSSFTAGELAPALGGRVDLAKYAQGCRTLQNMVVRPHGGAVKRPGFQLVDGLPGQAVLLPFVFNNEQSYCLIFGDYWLRVATAEGMILREDGSLFELGSPYSLEQAARLSYAQSADVLFLACQGMRPHKLKRLGHASWEFEVMQFSCPLAPPEWDSRTTSTVVSRYNQAYGPGASQGYAYMQLENYEYRRINEALYVRTEETVTSTVQHLSFTNGAVDSAGKTSPAQLVTPYTYVITAVNADGRESEASAGADITGPSSNNWQAGDYITLRWKAVDGAEEYRVYKSEFGGRPGYIATTGDLMCRDYNTSPSLSEGPPVWEDPFVLTETDGSVVEDFPAVVCLFEQRLVFASTARRPQTIWMSRSGDYDNFSVSKPLKADDALELTIASNEVSRLCWMAPLRSLVMGAGGMEWEVASTEGAFTAKTAQAKPQSYRGSAPVRALIIDNTILHVTRSGNEVRDFKYDFGSDSYAGTDRTILARHLFEGRQIVSWTYQSAPDSIIWAVRDDGALCGMTFQQEHEVSAWHRHETAGTFLAVCSVPAGSDDVLFVVVERDGSFFLERMAPAWLGDDPAECVFLDCALTARSAAGATTFTGLEHLEGRTVGVLADGAVLPAQVVRNGVVILPRPAHVVTVGLPYTARLETMPVEILAQEGASLGRKKQINAVNLLFERSGPSRAGCGWDRLQDIAWRTTEPYGAPPALHTGMRRVVVPEYARNQATVCVESEVPLPLSVLAAMPEVEVR